MRLSSWATPSVGDAGGEPLSGGGFEVGAATLGG